MEKRKRIALWLVVVAMVFSLAVCQKKAQQEESDKTPQETALSAAPEKEIEPVKEPAAQEKELVKTEKTPEKPAEEVAAVEEAAPVEEPAKEIARDDAAAVIELAKGGKIVFKFYPQDAPKTVDNFIKLANKGYYDGLTFHRVVPDFVAQGGCPKGDGTGGPGYTIKAEFNSQKHLDGAVSMARSNHPDSAGSQFYICLGAQSFLDGQYTVFGQVIEGMELVKGIQVGDVMKKVSIVDKASVEK